ncbi:hypothetical protein CRENBAI_006720 [Crenichthys baileyi]|uniref:Uncharacterized protein n=1 Tax=Crenichthys baileyi TaxID=28760 RepID=A0AAV9S164_9TELE
MESENRMRGRKRKEGERETGSDKVRAMEGAREKKRDEGGGAGGLLKMMIHPDPSECCHVPPSRRASASPSSVFVLQRESIADYFLLRWLAGTMQKNRRKSV